MVELECFPTRPDVADRSRVDDCGILAGCLTVHIVHDEHENGKAIEEDGAIDPTAKVR
jgi:hypothetical protein